MDHIYLVCLANLVQGQTRFVLPPIIPNDFMFEKFKHTGADRALVYAWVTRDIMSAASGLPVNDDSGFLKKLEYMY